MNNDVYAISGRIKNLIATNDLTLTSTGNILVNYYTLVLKELYDFANNLDEKNKEDLNKILINAETMPVKFIGVITPKEDVSCDYFEEDENDPV